MPPLRTALALTLWLYVAGAGAAHESIKHLGAGQWFEIAHSALSEVFPAKSNHPAWGVIGPAAVTGAWGGAAFDSKRETLIITGGGHADYGGNEVYEFDLNTLRWSRVTEPSAMRALKDGMFEVVGSQAPVSSHTYDGLVYHPQAEQMFKFCGSYYESGNCYDLHAYAFAPAKKSWRRLAKAPRGVIEVASDVDTKTGQVVVSVGVGLMFYDFANDSWQVPLLDDGEYFAAAAAIDPLKRLFVQVMNDGQVTFYRLTDAPRRARVKLSGDQSWSIAPGIAHHAPSGAMVIWDGDRAVWTLDTTRWTVQKLTNEGGGAPSMRDAQGRRKTTGIYGRWQYVPSIDTFIGYNHTRENVWLYRLPAAPARP